MFRKWLGTITMILIMGLATGGIAIAYPFSFNAAENLVEDSVDLVAAPYEPKAIVAYRYADQSEVAVDTVEPNNVKVADDTDGEEIGEPVQEEPPESHYDITLLTNQVVAGVSSNVGFTVSSEQQRTAGNIRVAIGDKDVTDKVAYEKESDSYIIRDIVVVQDTVLRLTDSDGESLAEAPIKAVKPIINVNHRVVTEGFRELLIVQISDPLTGKDLSAKLKLQEHNLATVEYWDNRNRFSDRQTIGDTSLPVHSLWIRAQRQSKHAQAWLSIEVLLDAPVLVDTAINVEPATLNLDAEPILKGSNSKVLLVLNDARQKSLAGRLVYVGNRLLGTTNSDGELEVNLYSFSTGRLRFWADTEIPEVKVEATVSVIDRKRLNDTVTGEQTLSLTTKQEQLTAGIIQEVVFSVKSEDGFLQNNILAAKDSWLFLGEEDVTSKVQFDPNTFEYTVSDVVVKEDTTLRLTTDYGKYYGEVELATVRPEVVFSRTTLTEGFRELVTARIVDPLSGQYLEGKLVIHELGLTGVEYWDKRNRVAAKAEIEATSAAEHTFWIRAARQQAKETGIAVDVILEEYIPLKELLPVDSAVLELGSMPLLAGESNELRILYLDAQGKPLSEGHVYMGKSQRAIGTPNSKGEIVTTVYPLNEGLISFYADTELEPAAISATKRVARDEQAPIISTAYLPVKTEDSAVTLKATVRDDSYITAVYINGQEVALARETDELEYEAELMVGNNTFEIVAHDLTGKTTSKTVTIERVAPLPDPEPEPEEPSEPPVKEDPPQEEQQQIDWPLSLEMGVAPPSWQSAPYALEDGTVMVPVRSAVASLQGTMQWSADSNELLIETRSGTSIRLYVGSTTIVVDDINYTMEPVAEQRAETVFAPVRYLIPLLGGRVEEANGTTIIYQN